jgi:DNA modification methylase
MAGSGTTHKVAKILNRNCISSDITPQENYIVEGDAQTFNPGKQVQMIIFHPPYYNIIKYSNDPSDISNCQSLKHFLAEFDGLIHNLNQYLDKNRIMVLVCGNIYLKSEEVTLGVYCKDIIRKYGYTLKSHIIKDYG